LLIGTITNLPPVVPFSSCVSKYAKTHKRERNMIAMAQAVQGWKMKKRLMVKAVPRDEADIRGKMECVVSLILSMRQVGGEVLVQML
jgi:hypothetical protein